MNEKVIAKQYTIKGKDNQICQHLSSKNIFERKNEIFPQIMKFYLKNM
jgi:hypothetical protein